MVISMSFKHMSPSDKLREYTEEKCQRLTKYFKGRVHLTWTLEVNKLVRSAHCHLVGNHMDYFGHGDTEDFLASIDDAIDRIETQLRRHKEIVKDHHRAEPAPEPTATDDSERSAS